VNSPARRRHPISSISARDSPSIHTPEKFVIAESLPELVIGEGVGEIEFLDFYIH